MIISIMHSIFMYFLTLQLAISKNPVKLSMMLMLLSFLIFFKIYYFTSQVWIPILFFLIFMGGILMMFMILSSILPNEKNYKAKNFVGLLILLCVTFTSILKTSENFQSSKAMKSFLDSSSTMSTLMLLMLVYFFITILMVSKESNPMRKSLCHYEINFVN